MHILIVSPFFPGEKATHAGGRFIYEMIVMLAARHDIFLVTRIEEHEKKQIVNLKKFCKNIVIAEFQTPRKRSILNLFRIAGSYLNLAGEANKILRAYRFDIVLVEYVEAGLFLHTKNQDTGYILGVHDVIAKPYERIYRTSTGFFRRIYSYLAWKLAAGLEKYTAGKFDLVYARSVQERELLLSMNPALPVELLPHPAGLDMDTAGGDEAVEPDTLLFLGAMHREANIRGVFFFHDKVLPVIKEKIPGVRWFIVGNSPPPEVEALHDGRSVFVTGFVEDTSEYYKKCSVFVAPILIGGGIIVKNLDALAAGRPVVTTSYGNEGIGAQPGRDIFVADDPGEFAGYVLMLLQNKILWKEIAGNGRKFVLDNYGRTKFIDILEAGFEKVKK